MSENIKQHKSGILNRVRSVVVRAERCSEYRADNRSEHYKRSSYRLAFVASLAVVIIIGVTFAIRSMLLTPKQNKNVLNPITTFPQEIGNPQQAPLSSNRFILLAYTLEEHEDGSEELREIDLFEEADISHSYYDAQNGLFLVNVGLKGDGDNIKSIEFFVETGVFAIQLAGNSDIDVLKTQVDSGNRLTIGDNHFFFNIGNSLIIDSDARTDDILLFWGIYTENPGYLGVPCPEEINIHTKANFYDGTSAEQTVTIHYAAPNVTVIANMYNEDELKRMNDEYEYYMNIPLDECRLMPETEDSLTVKLANIGYDELYYEFDIGYGNQGVLVQVEHLEFDESGVARSGLTSGRDGGMYIVVIKRETDGELTGMVYKLPPLSTR